MDCHQSLVNKTPTNQTPDAETNVGFLGANKHHTIMNPMFSTPDKENQRVYQVWANGLLDSEFIKYDQALLWFRLIKRDGHKARLTSRFLDESEY
jgi:hypothetical protein